MKHIWEEIFTCYIFGPFSWARCHSCWGEFFVYEICCSQFFSQTIYFPHHKKTVKILMQPTGDHQKHSSVMLPNVPTVRVWLISVCAFSEWKGASWKRQIPQPSLLLVKFFLVRVMWVLQESLGDMRVCVQSLYLLSVH